MDPRLLQYYNRELQHVREMGAEFAREFPKVAGRLGIENLECADPYVERLLESFAFMAARIQLKLDAEFPRFTQHLFELVYPHYLAPLPSMMVVQMQPKLDDPSLADGGRVPRGSALRSVNVVGEETACEYRTAHDLTLWPLELTEARYFASTAALANLGIEQLNGVRAGVRLRFRCTVGSCDELALDTLPLFLTGSGDVPKTLYEQFLASGRAVLVRPKGGSDWHVRLPATAVRRYGFDPEQALLPFGRRSFDGYRLLQEYFAFPERYLFVELAGLGPALRRCGDAEFEVFVLFDRSVGWLEQALDQSHLALFCTPAVNLFPKTADRVHVDRALYEYHVLADRTRPLDFEVHSLTAVRGYAGDAKAQEEFLPLYAASDRLDHHERHAYFTVRREPRLISSRARRQGARSSYVGSEVYVALVDSRERPMALGLRQLEFSTLCTNRDLPLHLTLGVGSSDFHLDVGAPVESVRCLAGPTTPRQPAMLRTPAWALLSHLSLNYLSLVDEGSTEGARLIRDMLALYGDANDVVLQKQLEGIKAIDSAPIVRRLPAKGPITFGRGLEISITCEETAFEGTGAFLFGAVMEEFFSRYVSLNSFTETVLRSTERREIMRWPARTGRRHRA